MNVRTTRANLSRSEKTREKLVAAARRVFRRKGYLHATVDDIVKSCRVARGTFYLYFPNKRGIFLEVVERAVNELLEAASDVRPQGTPFERIRESNRRYMQAWVSNRDILKELFTVSMFDDEVAQHHTRIRERFIRRIAQSIQRRQDLGQARLVDPVIAAHALSAMVDWFTYLWAVRNQPPEPDLERLAHELSLLWYHAVFLDTHSAHRSPESPDG